MFDGAHYFHNLSVLFQRARHRIFIIGWDLHTELLLRRDEGQELSLTDCLQAVLKKNKALEVYILVWRFSPIYFTERELFQKLKLSRQFLRRLHFLYDGQHPLGASHHQKIVVIDNLIAFCGGIDLTSNRWDEPDHAATHRLRRNPNQEDYQPFHDLQLAADGDLAKQLACVAEARWHRASGKSLPSLSTDEIKASTWTLLALAEDSELKWDHILEASTCSVKLTMPAYKKWSEIRQIESSYHHLIAAAKSYIYIENQYFTSTRMTEQLAQRLTEDTPPSVIIVLPEMAEGFLEREAMLRLQDSCLEKLRQTDHKSRLRLLFPMHESLTEGMQIKVHSKLILVDDEFMQLGSANLNNRSMGLDTECDVSVRFETDEQKDSLRHFLANEIAHFCSDQEPNRIIEQISHRGLLELIDQIVASKESKRLADLSESRRASPSLTSWSLFDEKLLDWQRPLNVERLIDRTVYQPSRRKTKLFRSFSLRTDLTLAGIVLFAVLMLYVDLDLKAALAYVRTSFDLHSESTLQNILMAIIIFSAGGFLMIPVNLMILTYASLFHGFEAITYILLGVAASATTGYGFGRLLSQSLLRSMIPERFFEIAKKIRSRHLLPIILVRTTPVAPFSLINLLAGSFHVNFVIYFVGTMLGILPGVISLVFFQNSLFDFIKNPNWQNGLLFALALVIVIYLFYILNRRLSTPDESKQSEERRVSS